MAGSLFCFVFLLSLLAGGHGGGQDDSQASLDLWCVSMNNADDAALQGALNWACGQGGADCGPIQQGGACYFPSDIGTMASYAFNNYYLTHGLTDDSCNFGGTAALISLNPSKSNCKFPSSSSVNNRSHSGMPTTVGLGPASQDLNGSSQTITLRSMFLTIVLFLISIMLVPGLQMLF